MNAASKVIVAIGAKSRRFFSSSIEASTLSRSTKLFFFLECVQEFKDFGVELFAVVVPVDVVVGVFEGYVGFVFGSHFFYRVYRFLVVGGEVVGGVEVQDWGGDVVEDFGFTGLFAEVHEGCRAAGWDPAVGEDLVFGFFAVDADEGPGFVNAVEDASGEFVPGCDGEEVVPLVGDAEVGGAKDEAVDVFLCGGEGDEGAAHGVSGEDDFFVVFLELVDFVEDVGQEIVAGGCRGTLGGWCRVLC